MSGAAKAAGAEFSGDVVVPVLGRGEVKRRRDGWRTLYEWLDGMDFLAVRADRREWLIVLSVDKLLQILEGQADGDD